MNIKSISKIINKFSRNFRCTFYIKYLSLNKNNFNQNKLMAERVGFEPTVPLTVHKLSKPAPSTTRPSLHENKNKLNLNSNIHIIIYKVILNNIT